jgi:hypothetical protein
VFLVIDGKLSVETVKNGQVRHGLHTLTAILQA